MIYARSPSPFVSLLLSFIIAILVIIFGFVMLGMHASNNINSRVIPFIILIGLPFIWSITLDVIDRVLAIRSLAHLLKGFNEEDIEYILHLLTDASTVSLVPRMRFEHRWQRLVEFLNSDHFGSIARTALFQCSPEGRIRYFKQAARIAFRGAKPHVTF
jgi:hypothetical protein